MKQRISFILAEIGSNRAGGRPASRSACYRRALLRVQLCEGVADGVERALLAQRAQLVAPALVRRRELLQLGLERAVGALELRQLALLRVRRRVQPLLHRRLQLSLGGVALHLRVGELPAGLDLGRRLLALKEREGGLVVAEGLEERLEQRRLAQARLADHH